MLSRKTMIKGQKMQDYLEVYEELINIRVEYFARSTQERSSYAKKLFHKLSDETGIVLQDVIERALNDKQIWG